MPFCQSPAPFLRLLGILALMLAVIAGNRAEAQGKVTPEHSVNHAPLIPVILVERPGAVNEFTVDPTQVRQMVEFSLLKLTSSTDIATAWTRLGITPQDVVGIKINTDGGSALCSHHALIHAICDGLRATGVPSSQIILWDKFQDKMRAAGYAPRASYGLHAAIAAVVPDNYDPDVYYKSGILGSLMWGDFRFMQPASFNGNSDSSRTRSYYTKLVTQTCTKLINVPVLTDNSYVGMNGCLSSLALGCVDNNRRFQGPPTYGDPAICEILDQPFIKRKVVVNILDALVAQCAGGPKFNPLFCKSIGALYVSRDPVAIDSLVLPRLEQMRRAMNVTPIGKTANYIKDAPYYKLGTTDRSRIQFLRIP